MREPIFFHEDFYKQIELIPRQNYFAAKRVLHELPESDGSKEGFLSCTIRPEHLVKVEDLEVSFTQVSSTLTPLALSFHDNITSGYSTATYKVDDTVAWGFERLGVFVEYKNEMVKSIWLCKSARFSSNNSGQALKKALLTLANDFNLILVDWNQEIIIDLSKEKKVKDYLIEILAFDNTI